MKLNLLSLLLLITCGWLEAQSLDNFTLINAETDADIKTIVDNDAFDIAETGSQLNIRANTTGTIGSIKFLLDGATQYIENVAPYAMVGDDAGNYKIWTPSLGAHTLTGTAYAESGAKGAVIGTITINFTFSETVVPIDPPAETGTGEVTISGELKKWHKVMLSFDGPAYKETDSNPNPFLDFRLNVTFTNGTSSYTIPGYFAVDGNAGETSADSGNVWRVNFSPDEVGTWSYVASFRIGRDIAVNDDPAGGEAVSPIDGKSGNFEVVASDKTGNDFRGKGRLKYVGKHHLQFSETGEFFIKGGADAPENFLAYDGFDGEFKTDGTKDHLIKNWQPHVQDWNEGDPLWQSDKGKGIIGAVNYLSEQGLNVFSFLTMNIGGDDANVYPYVSSKDVRHLDVSKLEQWEVVFNHADKLGMYLHFKTQETENDQLLDGGNVARDRKLYYRELIARFSHHLALNWNLGEENTQTVAQRKDMAQYFLDHDPYQNHIVIHSYPDQQNLVYPTLLGNASKITGVSLQTNWQNVYKDTKKWVLESEKAGKNWVVANDEQGGANIGVPDDAFTGSPSLAKIRQNVLWGNLMANGAGVEYYFGYQRPHSDLSAQDYRSRATSWTYVKHALKFFREKVPFQDMKINEGIVSNGTRCLEKSGDTYLVYLPQGGTSNIDLSGVEEVFDVKWFDPVAGGDLQQGSVALVAGNGVVALGNAPSDPNRDWAILLVKTDASAIDTPLPVVKASVVTGEAPLVVTFDGTASQDNGTIASYEWNFGGDSIGTGSIVNYTFNNLGEQSVILTVTDNEGKKSSTTILINVKADKPNAGCGQAETWLSAEFPLAGSKFYIDKFTGIDLLAITPNESTGSPVSATVSQTFEGDNCNYNIIFHGVGESDGQAQFKVFVNDQQLGETIVLPLSSEDWEVGEAFNTSFEGISLKNGDVIKVEGATASADGKEWSRARWLKLEIEPAACIGAAFEENDGYVVFEAEDVTLNDAWIVTNSFAEDALGEGHIEYTGSNSYGSVPENTIMTYEVKINTPGVYQFKWRSRNGKDAVKFDEENDSWLKIEADEFYGMKAGNKTNIGDHYSKIWIQDLNKWSWNCFGEHAGVNGMDVFARFDNPGTYKINIAGRSHNHPIDRIALYQTGKGGIAMSNDTPPSSSGCNTGSGKKDYASPINQQGKLFKNPILIDGNNDKAWDFVDAVEAKYESAGKELPAEADLSFKYKVGYDETNLYLQVDVKDDQLKAFGGSGNDFSDWDNIQLYINADNKHNAAGAYGDDAIMVRMNYGVDNNFFSGTGTWKGSGDHAGFAYKSVDVAGGYILEAKIPWSGLLPSGTTIEPGKILGFDVAVGDRDSGSEIENHISWANNTKNNTAFEDTRKFGTLELMAAVPNYPKKTDWKVLFVDSEVGPGNKDNAIDDDPETFWHTEWKDAQPALPHEIQIDMAKSYAVTEVHYLHRQDPWGPNGAIGKYEIYISDDPDNWGSAVKTGELSWPDSLENNYKLLHVIKLDETVTGRYLRLVALSEAQNKPEIPFTAIAELSIVEEEVIEEVLAISPMSQGQLLAFPNPVKNQLEISGITGVADLEIFSLSGNSLIKRIIDKGSALVNVTALNEGVYIVQINQENAVAQNIRIIKE